MSPKEQKSLTERLRAQLEPTTKIPADNSPAHDYLAGRRDEHTRLKLLFEAMVECINNLGKIATAEYAGCARSDAKLSLARECLAKLESALAKMEGAGREDKTAGDQ